MRHTWILSALVGLSFVQCSSKETPSAKFPDAKAFCAGMAAAECNGAVLGACLATSDKENCLAIREAACVVAYVTPASGLTYDSGKAEACVNAVSAAYSDALIKTAEFASVAQVCGTVFSGTGTKGTTCDVNTDCKQSAGLSCVLHSGTADAGGTVQGTCQVPQIVTGGASCSAPEDQCAVGFYCDPASAHCFEDGALGANCDNTALCDTGLMCSAGKCVAKLADGRACTSAEQCASGICLENLKLCAAQQTLGPSEPFCSEIRGQADGG